MKWTKAPQYLTDFNGLKQEANLPDGSTLGIFKEKHPTGWTYRRRIPGDCWGHGYSWDTKREAVKAAEFEGRAVEAIFAKSLTPA